MKQLGYGTKAIRQVIGPLTMKSMKKDSDAAFRHVSAEESQLMKTLHDDGLGVKAIASTVHRSSDTVSKHLFKKNKRQKPQHVGRPVVITEAKFKQIQKAHKKLCGSRGVRKSPSRR